MAHLGAAAHGIEIGTGGDDLQQSAMFRRKGICAAQAEHPSDRTRREVLNRSIEAVHEDDRRNAGVPDLGNPRGQNHVDDNGVRVVTPGSLGDALA